VSATGGGYTVHQGDTLQSIAAGVWGDASLWYLLAEANGLTGAETLVEGQAISVPNKVANFHNNASTFSVYDPNQALGDTSPSAPKPPKKAGCGVVGPSERLSPSTQNYGITVTVHFIIAAPAQN
jgi:LysM repeat protein